MCIQKYETKNLSNKSIDTNNFYYCKFWLKKNNINIHGFGIDLENKKISISVSLFYQTLLKIWKK